MNKIYAIILAGGKGLRFGNTTPKQFLTLKNKPLIIWTLEAFNSMKSIDYIIVVSPEEYLVTIKTLISEHTITKVIQTIKGGATRQESSYNAVMSNNFNSDDILLIHDAARPFISDEIINNCIDETKKYGAAGVYVSAIDTITEIEDGFVKSIPPRKNLYYAQTPQSFKYTIIKRAHEKALQNPQNTFTDDVSLVLGTGCKVKKIEGDYNNIKITNPQDFELANWIIKKRL